MHSLARGLSPGRQSGWRGRTGSTVGDSCRADSTVGDSLDPRLNGRRQQGADLASFLSPGRQSGPRAVAGASVWSGAVACENGIWLAGMSARPSSSRRTECRSHVALSPPVAEGSRPRPCAGVRRAGDPSTPLAGARSAQDDMLVACFRLAPPKTARGRGSSWLRQPHGIRRAGDPSTPLAGARSAQDDMLVAGQRPDSAMLVGGPPSTQGRAAPRSWLRPSKVTRVERPSRESAAPTYL